MFVLQFTANTTSSKAAIINYGAVQTLLGGKTIKDDNI